MKHAVVLLADGCEEVEAITPIDFLRRAGIQLTIAGVTGRDIVGGHGIRISSDSTVDQLSPEFDCVVIPGGVGGAENIANNGDAMALIKKVMDQGHLVAAICAAPALVLGRHDLIGDRSYTCYPGFEEQVSRGTHREDRVVLDGKLLTSRGPGTAAEFSVAIIRELLGSSTADEVATQTLQP